MALLERQTHLAELAAAQRDAAAGRGGLVIVTGEAGVGKTALVRHFVEQCGLRVLWGLCDDLMTPRPLGAFRDMFAGLGDTGDLETFLDGVLDALEGDEHPPVAVVEDAHWADQATLDAIRFIGRRIGRMHALLVITYRDDEVPADHPLRLALGAVPASDTRRVRVTPLSQDAVATMAQGSGLDAAKVYELTGGNPFYVQETLAHPGALVPPSVQDAVMARVLRLSEPGRLCAELTSTVPGAAELWLLDACGVAVGALDDALRGGVLRRQVSTVAFSHELVRRAVEQGLTEARRRQLNGRVLDALAARDADPARLIHHAERAGHVAAVVEYAPRAAERAAAIGAHVEASQHYLRAVALADQYPAAKRLDLLEAAARTSHRSARFDEAHGPAARAVSLCQASGDQRRLGRLLCLLSEIEWSRGRGTGARSAIDDAVFVLEQVTDGNADLIAAYAQQARMAMVDHRPDAAIAWGDKAFAVTDWSDGSVEPADLLVTVSTARMQREPHDAEPLVEALHIALEQDDIHAASRAYVNLAHELTLHMRYLDAYPHIEDGLAYLAKHDQLGPIDHMWGIRAHWNLDQARWAAAEKDAARVASPGGTSRVMAELVLGLLQARRGEDEAVATLEHVAECANATGDAQLVIPAALARAELAWLHGDVLGLATVLKPVLDVAYRSGVSHWVGKATLWQHRLGSLRQMPAGVAEPYRLQVAGRWRQAAAAWAALGCAYEEADALADASEPEALLEALRRLDLFGAKPRADMVRHRLADLGVHDIPRGPHQATRANPGGLTRRQMEILHLLADSLSYKDIASQLHISVKTVDHHVSAIRTKLQVSTRAAAVIAARQLGLLPDYP